MDALCAGSDIGDNATCEKISSRIEGEYQSSPVERLTRGNGEVASAMLQPLSSRDEVDVSALLTFSPDEFSLRHSWNATMRSNPRTRVITSYLLSIVPLRRHPI